MVFGYGGYFGVAVGLLEQGAKHVVLLDPYASLDDKRNKTLMDQYAGYVRREGKRVVPEPSSITLWHDTLKIYADREQSKVDLLLSSSVMEHVGSPEAEAEQMARVLEAGGAQLHFVDLRDHYFRYPFEMLCYSEEIWRRFLNPGSNLNRFRAWQYEASFKKYFDDVRWAALEHDRPAFLNEKSRIRSEFLTGDDQIDAVTKISITTM